MPNNLAAIFDPNSPFLIATPVVFMAFKALFLIAFSLYVLYAVVIVRQVSLMSKTISAPLEQPLKGLSLLHLVGAIIIWIFALIVRI